MVKKCADHFYAFPAHHKPLQTVETSAHDALTLFLEFGSLSEVVNGNVRA